MAQGEEGTRTEDRVDKAGCKNIFSPIATSIMRFFISKSYLFRITIECSFKYQHTMIFFPFASDLLEKFLLET